jgi:alpha-galactosidase
MKTFIIFNLALFFLSLSVSNLSARKKSEMTKKIKIAHIEKDFPISELDNKSWKKAKKVSIENYWSGKRAEIGRHAKATLLWSDAAFYIRFEANQTEPLVINQTPNLKSKTRGLWDRDVCEIFVAPNADEPRRYYEFEIAPTGEWIDLAIHQLPDRRETDFEYNSGMQSAAKIGTNKIVTAIKIEWKAFGKTPQVNEIWKGNLFRCVGAGDARGYLSWQATKTETPNFHVPEAFGEFQFIK